MKTISVLLKPYAKLRYALGLGSEGEIGKIGGTEDDITVDEKDAMITTVAEALDFSERTGVDYLAVSIGTAHGIYKTTPQLKLDRLTEIKEAVKKPIVLHGGSGVPDDQVVEAIKRGVAKINVDTELRQGFITGVQAHWADNPTDYILADVMNSGIESMKKVVQQKIRLFGSNGKA
ncbi:class II fructose-bisphosphate aldolase [Psychromonas sp. KJ10-10]|uniref:class II fructose-bisphosphate aldolase n=1 Tax=Psychromonas sp. KJ10-10 TaxID=3391823 RepID=UPI0039B37B1F